MPYHILISLVWVFLQGTFARAAWAVDLSSVTQNPDQLFFYGSNNPLDLNIQVIQGAYRATLRDLI